MSSTVYRLIAPATWSVAIVLLVFGLVSNDPEHQRDCYAFAFVSSILAATCSVLLALESLVSGVMGREMARSRRMLATAVATALADELDERNQPTPPELTVIGAR